MAMDQEVLKMVTLSVLRPWLFNWQCLVECAEDTKNDQVWKEWLEQSGLLRVSSPCGTGLEGEDFIKTTPVKVVLELLKITKTSEDEKQIQHLYERLENLSGPRTDYGMVVRICQQYPYARILHTKVEHSAPDIIFIIIAFVCSKYVLIKRIVESRGIKCFHDALKESKIIEELRARGNEAYRKKLYESAISIYTVAIQAAPYQYKLYSNRAQAYLNTGQNQEAASDGFRCITLEPMWDKGWQRYGQGLYNMGMKKLALQVNAAGLLFFPDDPLLFAQQKRFLCDCDEMEATTMQDTIPVKKTKAKSKKSNTEQKFPNTVPPLVSTDEEEDDPTEIKEKQKDEDLEETAVLVKKRREELQELEQKLRDEAFEERKQIAQVLNEAATKQKVEEKLREQQQKAKQKEKRREEEDERRRREEKRLEQEKKREKAKEPMKAMSNPNIEFMATTTEIRRLLKEGSEALVDVRTRNAIHCYERALIQMKPKVLSAMRYQDLDVAIVRYALGVAYVDVGSEKEVDAGLKQFNEVIDTFKSLKFPLAWLGVGMAYCRWNRFTDAVQALQKGLRIESKIHFGVHTWPETTLCIEQTRPGKLKEAFEKQLWLSRHPPRPDAVCRFESCSGHYKVHIYFTDPDFKGFVRVSCYAQCTIEYHPDCWKKFKTDGKLSDKDILVGRCFTPDCWSTCKMIEVVDHNGEVPRRLEGNPPIRHKEAKKCVRKMAPSSHYTINRRKERKEHRKQCRLEAKHLKEEENLKILEDLEAAARKKEEASASAVPPRSVDQCVVLMKKDEEDMAKVGKYKKKKRLRDKPAKVMTLEEFQDRMTQENGYAGGMEDYEEYLQGPVGTFGMLEEFEDYGSAIYPGLDPTNPFSVPQSIQDQVYQFEAQHNGGATYGSPITKESPVSYAAAASNPEATDCDDGVVVDDEEDEEQRRRAVKESLFTLFREILREHGPLHIEDERITSVVDDFPADTMEVVQDVGGIGRFLIQSLHFAMVDEVVSLMKDAAKARKVANKRKMMLRKTDSPGQRHKIILSSASETSLTASVISSKNIQSLDDRGSVGSETKNKNILPSQKLYEGIAGRDHDTESIATSGSDLADARSETLKYTVDALDMGVGATKARGHSRSECDVSKTDVGTALRSGYAGFELPRSHGGSPVPRHKSSPWQVPVDPTVNSNGIQEFLGDLMRAEQGDLEVTGKPNKMDPEEILNCFRLSANRLVSAVELGNLAVHTQITLSVEVHFMEGWRLEEGLEDADSATREEAIGLLQDAINTVHSNSVRTYNALGADIYFFGTGGSSGNDWSAWIKSPEVLCNRRIVIAMYLEDVDLCGVDFRELDHTTAETLMALKNAVSVIKSTTDRFRGSDNIQKAMEPILSVIGRKVATDHPETQQLLNHKPSKLPPMLSLSTSGVRSPARVQSPIARPSSSVSSSPLPSTPTRFQNSPLSQSASSSPGPMAPSTKPPSMNLAASLWTASRGYVTDTGGDGTGIDGLNNHGAAPSGGSVSCYHQGSREEVCPLAERVESMHSELECVLNEKDVYQIQVSDLQEQVQVMQKEKATLKQELKQWEQNCLNLSEENKTYAWRCSELSQQVSLNAAAAEQSMAEIHQQLQVERWQKDQLLEEKKSLQEAQELERKNKDLRLAGEVMRAETAEKALLRLKLDVGLQILERSQNEAESQILKIQQQRGMYRDNQLTIPKELGVAIDTWQEALEKIKEVKVNAMSEFETQMFKIGQGERLEDLPPLDVPCPPSLPDIAHLQMGAMSIPEASIVSTSSSSGSSSNSHRGDSFSVAPPSGSSKPRTGAPPGFAPSQPELAAGVGSRMKTVSRPPGLGVGGSPATGTSKIRNSFEKIIEVLLPKYPEFTRIEISTYVQELRRSRGSLSGMSMMEVLGYVENLILQEQQQRIAISESQASLGWSVGVNPVTAHPTGVDWGGASLGGRPPGNKPPRYHYTEEEDPCTICLDELPHHPTELACRHKFHDHCIRKWLSEKSTCPICTKHTLLNDEFPALS